MICFWNNAPHVKLGENTGISVMYEMLFAVYSVIGGYHEYKNMWVAMAVEELSCRREPTYQVNQSAVVNNWYIKGHLPSKISCINFVVHCCWGILDYHHHVKQYSSDIASYIIKSRLKQYLYSCQVFKWLLPYTI